MDRRDFLKGVVVTGGLTAAAAHAERETVAPNPDSVGMLYDSTLCIGCKACVVACREANGTQPEQSDGLHDQQTELNGNTKNVIKLWQDPQDASVFAFMKQQCMHCVDPACVNACMIGAFHKDEQGAVTWASEKCIGCRYCQIACPFNIPKLEWNKPIPKIVKCELCPERRAEGKQPACCEVCPRQAVIFGKLGDLLKEAHARLEANPKKYVQKVYGERDGGGTQVLYLSAVPFENLGLPKLTEKSGAAFSRSINHGIYQGFITPAVLYVGLAATVVRNWRKGLSKIESHEAPSPEAPEKKSEEEKP